VSIREQAISIALVPVVKGLILLEIATNKFGNVGLLRPLNAAADALRAKLQKQFPH